MRNVSGWILVFICLIAVVYGCQKDLNKDQAANLNKNVSSGSNNPTSGLSYGDTIFYLKNQPGDYTVMPVSVPAGPGYFKANPYGLFLDSATGLINVTKSETGLRYKVYYLNMSGQAVDSVKLVISGIDYKDSIFQIQTTPTTYDTAFPIYNAKPNPALPCGDDDEDDDGDIDDDDNQCVFDETDLNDDGNDDIPGVIQDKLLVDIKKGTIDAEASFHAGVFAFDQSNGATKDFTFYYRLQDPSNRALNKITVRLYRFYSMNDIPQWLLDELQRRKNLDTQINSRPANGNRAASLELGPKRPPIIIIVSS